MYVPKNNIQNTKNKHLTELETEIDKSLFIVRKIYTPFIVIEKNRQKINIEKIRWILPTNSTSLSFIEHGTQQHIILKVNTEYVSK